MFLVAYFNWKLSWSLILSFFLLQTLARCPVTGKYKETLDKFLILNKWKGLWGDRYWKMMSFGQVLLERLMKGEVRSGRSLPAGVSMGLDSVFFLSCLPFPSLLHSLHSVLLRYYLHTIKFTHFKCPTQRFLVNLVVQPSSQLNFITFPSPQW